MVTAERLVLTKARPKNLREMDKTGFMAKPGSWLAAGVCIGMTVAFPPGSHRGPVLYDMY